MGKEFVVKHGLIVQSDLADSSALQVFGTNGSLFTVTDSLVGDIFAVSDISGVHILNVNSSGAVSVDGSIASTGEVTAYGVAGGVLAEGLIQAVYAFGNLGDTFSNAVLTDTFNAYTINQINNRFTYANVQSSGITNEPAIKLNVPINITALDRDNFRDVSVITGSNSGGGFASYDTSVRVDSTNQNHCNGFQERIKYNGTGTLTQTTGFGSTPENNGGGHIGQRIAFSAWDFLYNTGTVGLNIGFYCVALTAGTSNWGFYALGTMGNYFGGKTFIGYGGAYCVPANFTAALNVSGDISTTTLNGHTFTAGSSTFTGTAGQTYTFPTATSTLLASGGALGTPSSGTLSSCDTATASVKGVVLLGATGGAATYGHAHSGTYVPYGSGSSVNISGWLTASGGVTLAIVSAPANNASGSAGNVKFCADAIYICTATNTWRKATLYPY